jgi:hypothetical protein
MVTMNQVHARVEAPVVVPHPFGLFSIAPPASPTDTSWQAGAMWESWACVDAALTTDPCISGAAQNPKDFDFCGWLGQYRPITVYLGIKGSGASADVAAATALATLQGAEETAIEEHVWAQFGAAATPVSATSLPLALAQVEAALARHYKGTGVIHMNRGVATLLSTHLVNKGDHLETFTGTPVVAGSGYNQELSDEPVGGDAVIFGTGAFAVRRSDVLAFDAWDTAINDHLALAERTYVAGWDCYITGRTATV